MYKYKIRKFCIGYDRILNNNKVNYTTLQSTASLTQWQLFKKKFSQKRFAVLHDITIIVWACWQLFKKKFSQKRFAVLHDITIIVWACWQLFKKKFSQKRFAVLHDITIIVWACLKCYGAI